MFEHELAISKPHTIDIIDHYGVSMITLNEALIALGGGVLIGTSASVLLAFNGRVAGISGIIGGLFYAKEGDVRWRLIFITGMIAAGLALASSMPEAFTTLDRPSWTIILSGLLVGIGTRMGNGCTSGHGVCGLSRFSKRSFYAVCTFLGTGILTATIVGQILGGVA